MEKTPRKRRDEQESVGVELPSGHPLYDKIKEKQNEIDGKHKTFGEQMLVVRGEYALAHEALKRMAEAQTECQNILDGIGKGMIELEELVVEVLLVEKAKNEANGTSQ